MGVLYETYQSTKNKKRCTVCGCLMDDKHDGDVCECCKDDMNDQEDEVLE